MTDGYFDFTPETMKYKGILDKGVMIDVPIDFDGIFYRCTCAAYRGKAYVVMPFRKVTPSIAREMGNKVEKSGYFGRHVYTVIVQIIDRRNIVVEYYSPEEDTGDNIGDIKELFEVSVGTMYMIGLTKNEVEVSCRDISMPVKV